MLCVLKGGAVAVVLAIVAHAGVPASIPKEAVSRAEAFVVAHDGRSYLYNYDAGIVREPFLENVYKPFGFSRDSRYFLYLKSNGRFPTFVLYSYDLLTGEDKKLSDESVQYAAWSPAADEFAYVSLDEMNRLHLSLYDLHTGASTAIASGILEPDFIEWSPNGDELLYISLTPLTPNFVADQEFRHELHRYSTTRSTDTVVPDVTWARFEGTQPVVLSRKTPQGLRQLPNPAGEQIRDFAMVGGQVFATVGESGETVVKRLDSRSGTSETVARGHIYTTTERGVVIREFANEGVTYSYLAAGSSQARLQISAFTANWKMPFGGAAYLVQGGANFTASTCDGAQCIITSHRNSLGFALDWQQVTEQGEGNTHVLAVEDGTVAAMQNSVTCNSNSENAGTCADYKNPCNDPSGGLGNYVSIAHPDGTFSFYGHMKFGSVKVSVNQKVTQGAYLGDQGHTGVAGTYNSYHGCGDHLHYQRQTAAAPWSQSVATNFIELPCVLTCASARLSANVENSSAAAGALTVTLEPSTITGSGTTGGSRVFLSSAAPVGGAKVALSSSSPNIASVPASVTVPAGATTAAFPVTTSGVTTKSTTTISAVFGGQTGTALLTVAPVSLSRLNLWQFSVTGGNAVNGNEIDLTSQAPNAFSLSVTSSAPAAASVPSTVTVAAGNDHVTFPITTFTVASTTNATITVSDGTVSKSQVLVVNPGGSGPTLTSVLPSSGTAGTAPPVTLTGTKFASGATVAVSGSGVTVSGVTVVSATRITATFTVAASAAAGARSVTVTTSGATTGAVTFTVVSNGPTLTSVAPSSGTAGTAVPVTLTGTKLASGATVAVSGSGVTVSGVTVVSATRITATFTVAANAAAGARNVTVTTSGATTGTVSFTVNGGGPTLTSILPSSGTVGTAVPVTLAGTNFVSGATVSTTSAGITVSNIVVAGATQITARFTIAAAAATGTFNVTVTAGARTSNAVGFTIAPAGTGGAIRVNAGGPAFTDALGQVWAASNGFNTVGSSISIGGTISGSAAPTLYKTARTGPTSGTNLTYTTAVANGLYTVNLKFVDGQFDNVGERVFNVVINGQTVLPNLDILARSRGTFIAVDIPVSVNVTTGQIAIQFVPVTQAPLIGAIEIIPGTPPAPTIGLVSPGSATAGGSVPVTISGSGFTSDVVVNAGADVVVTNVVVANSSTINATFTIPAGTPTMNPGVTVTTPGGTTTAASFAIASAGGLTRINAGGFGVTDSRGQYWAADTGFNANGGLSATSNTITGASAPGLYRYARYGNTPGLGQLAYTFHVPNGSYMVNLKCVDALETAAGQRVYNVAFNGQTVLTNFDMFARTGQTNQAIDVPIPVTVTGGQVVIDFDAVVFKPKINAIEIVPAPVPAPSIGSVSPAAMTAGTSGMVTISGSGFTSDVVVGAGPMIVVTGVSVSSSTTITANFAVATGTAPGTANLTVTTPGGTAVAPFTIQ